MSHLLAKDCSTAISPQPSKKKKINPPKSKAFLDQFNATGNIPVVLAQW